MTVEKQHFVHLSSSVRTDNALHTALELAVWPHRRSTVKINTLSPSELPVWCSAHMAWISGRRAREAATDASIDRRRRIRHQNERTIALVPRQWAVAGGLDSMYSDVKVRALRHRDTLALTVGLVQSGRSPPVEATYCGCSLLETPSTTAPGVHTGCGVSSAGIRVFLNLASSW